MGIITHTIISVICLFIAYQAGRWLGYRKGAGDLWTLLIHVFDAKELRINEDDELIVTKRDGTSKKVN
jgi:hypothetical protein